MAEPWSYDVFISHNRKEKPWVREVAKLLVEQGQRVFFDEESIAPGGNIIEAIEQAVTQSHYILLVVSRASIGSRWVAMETQFAIHDDPSGETGRVIPLIVEDMHGAPLRPALTAVNRVDLTDPATRDTRFRKVLAHLGVAKWTTVRLPLWPDTVDKRPITEATISVGGIEKALEWKWDGVKLLEEFIALDYETLSGLTAAHEGTPIQWAPIFMEHPQTWRMLFDNPGSVVGYWHFVPLFPDDYQLPSKGSCWTAAYLQTGRKSSSSPDGIGSISSKSA